MKHLFVAALALLLLCTAAFSMTREEYRNGFPLIAAVDECELVVLGTVSGMSYVNRLNMITTDITVTVKKVVRGTPNVNSTTVKFMVEGGIDAVRGKGLKVSGVPEFKMGEQVLLFLNDGTGDRFYGKYPHGSYHIHRRSYGKRKVEDGKVNILYPGEEGFRYFKMPVDLAVDLGKASLVDKAAAKRIEQRITDTVALSGVTKITLTDSTIESLKRQAKQILAKEEE